MAAYITVLNYVRTALRGRYSSVCTVMRGRYYVHLLQCLSAIAIKRRYYYYYYIVKNNNNHNGFICIAVLLDYTISAMEDSAYNRTQIIT